MQSAITEASNTTAVSRTLFYPLGAALLVLLVLPVVAWGIFEHLYPAGRAFLASIDLQLFKGQGIAWFQSTQGFMALWVCVVALLAVALTIGQVGSAFAKPTAWTIAGVAFTLAIASWSWHPHFGTYTKSVADGSFQQYQLVLLMLCDAACRVAAFFIVLAGGSSSSKPSSEEDYAVW